MPNSGHTENGTLLLIPFEPTRLIAVEKRRKDAARQCHRDEQEVGIIPTRYASKRAAERQGSRAVSPPQCTP